MPRVSSSLIRQARKLSRLLPPLLRAVPSLEQAKQELRWIQNELPKDRWIDAIRRRSKLEPLQYILGTQPFGPLEINCKKGVLIPRWETEEWVSKVADILQQNIPSNKSLKILDACTGSGCIPLLLSHIISHPTLEITCFDISDVAYNLAGENLKKYDTTLKKSAISIKKADLFDSKILEKLRSSENGFDFVTSNPPYIPVEDYLMPMSLNGLEKSVRSYEPRLALVGNLEFYEALIEHIVIPLNCKGFVFEVGYIEQVEYTGNLLNVLAPTKNWQTGPFYDSAGKIRAVVGWTGFTFLQDFCNNNNLD